MRGRRTAGASPKARQRMVLLPGPLFLPLRPWGFFEGSCRSGATSGLWCLVETAPEEEPCRLEVGQRISATNRSPERTTAVEGGRRVGAAAVVLWPSFGRGARGPRPSIYHEPLAHREARGRQPLPRPGQRDSPEAPFRDPQRP